MTELALQTALDLAQSIRKRELSPLELTQYFLDRIAQRDHVIGGFCHVAPEMAIATAQAQTEQLGRTDDFNNLPPFFGVPIGIKDLNAVVGMPVSYGVAALKDHIADRDDGVVKKLKQAGFVILGKTTTSQIGTFPYTEPPGFLPSRNPWHLDHTAGGSSGGSGAAVAAGFCPIAQGSDGGGSLRGPASCCGLVGFKPSRGRISNAPVGDYQSGIASNGPLSRTVLDAAVLVDVMGGYITGDPYWLPQPEIPFLQSTQDALPRLRIAYHLTLPPFSSSSVVQGGVKTAIAACGELGHILEEACFEAGELVEPFMT
ncbi:MAG: putative amidase, partial [Cyanobacteriota bacterium]